MDFEEVEWDWSQVWKDREGWWVVVNEVIGIPFARNGRVSSISD